MGREKITLCLSNREIRVILFYIVRVSRAVFLIQKNWDRFSQPRKPSLFYVDTETRIVLYSQGIPVTSGSQGHLHPPLHFDPCLYP